MLVAMHPQHAKEILEVLDGTPQENEFAEPLSEEEMGDYEPFSAEEVGQTIDLLKRYGVAVEN